MKTPLRLFTLIAVLILAPAAHAEIAPAELVAPKLEISGGMTGGLPAN